MQRVFGDLDALRYVDGRLDDERRAAFLAHLEDNPADRDRVALWARQNETLRAAFAGVALESIPPALRLAGMTPPRGVPAPAPVESRPPVVLRSLPARPPLRRRVPGAEQSAIAYLSQPRAAPDRLRHLVRLPLSAALLFGLALLIVYVVHGLLVQPATWTDDIAPRRGVIGAPSLASRAVDAYATYANDPVRPVEFAAAQQRDFARWTQRRIGVGIEAADLAAEGWTLLGGRLVPALDGPGAFFVYENRAGERLGLMVARALPFAPVTTELQAAASAAAMTWTGGAFSYAITVGKSVDWLSRNGEALKERVGR